MSQSSRPSVPPGPRQRANSDEKARTGDNSSFARKSDAPVASQSKAPEAKAMGTKPPDTKAPTSGSSETVQASKDHAQKSSEQTAPKKQEPEVLMDSRFSQFLKIFQFKTKDHTAGESCVATLPMSLFGKSSTLKDVRENMKEVYPVEEKFCYSEGSSALDTNLLTAYLVRENEDAGEEDKSSQPAESQPVESQPGVPSPKKDTKKIPCKVFLPYRPDEPEKPKPKGAITAATLSNPPFVVKIFEWSAGADGITSRGTLQAAKLNTKEPDKMELSILREILAKDTKMDALPKLHKFCTPKGITVTDETMTFSDYLKLEEIPADAEAELPSVSVFYKLDHPKNEFKKIELSELGSKVSNNDFKITGEEFKDGKKANTFKATDRAFAIADAGKIEKGATSNPFALDAGYLTEAEWAEVLRNCGILHGWVIDRQNNRITRAPKPAFRLRPKYVYAQAESKEIPVAETSTPTEQEVLTSMRKIAAAEAKAQAEAIAAAGVDGVAPPLRRIVKPVASIMPTFQVNDDSRIEITLTSHEFETSMAKNDFSSRETEGSLSGGYGGFAATLSAGHSKAASKKEKETNNTYNKTMIAKYLFPRADILLLPSDLEPTPELKAALWRVKRDRNITDLRAIYRDFGQLWCQRVTVGGRLQSTRVMEDKSKGTEEAQTETFKTSVGLQVTTPYVGAGIKHSWASGTDNTDNLAQEDKSERNVFEAVGGDTILASNPAAWASTVADYRAWRVIDRSSLTMMADAISAIAGLSEVKSWFLQAAPTLAKYLELPSSREMKLRFKLASPSADVNLSLSYKMKDAEINVAIDRPDEYSGEATYYLGHTKNADVLPREMIAKNTVEQDDNITGQGAKPIFSPQTYRAPVLQGYEKNLVGKSAFGSEFNQEFTNTIWNISAPYDEAIKHGSRVYIQTVPLPTTTTVPTGSTETETASTPVETKPLAVSGSTGAKAASSPAEKKSPAVTGSTGAKAAGTPAETKPTQVTGSTEAETAGTPEKKPLAFLPEPSYSLVVFRNQQSVFLPGLSDSSDRPIWRIHIVSPERQTEFIKEGDEIYFSFSFIDQTSGFRDFENDVFGRRRMHMPLDLQTKTLYLKLPWPRFEPLKPRVGFKHPPPNSMLLSTEPPIRIANGAKLVEVRTLPRMVAAAIGRQKKNPTILKDTATYALQDLTFRIDVVGNEGYGEADDGLLRGLVQNNKPLNQSFDLKVLEKDLNDFNKNLWELMLFLNTGK